MGHIGTYWDIFWQFLDDDMEPENDVTSPFYPKSRIRNENLRTFDSKTTAILYFVGFVISMCSSSPRLFFSICESLIKSPIGPWKSMEIPQKFELPDALRLCCHSLILTPRSSVFGVNPGFTSVLVKHGETRW
jgi:hypothetical protein